MNQLKAGALLNYVTIGLNTLLGLVYTPYMLRMLGQSEFGLYSLVASIIAYLTVLDFGFGNAIIRYTAKFRAESKMRDQWEMFGMFFIVYSVIGLISSGIGVGLYFNVDVLFDRSMTPDEVSQAKTMMLLLTANLALTFPLSIFGSIITAYEDFVFQKLINIARLLMCTGTIVALLYFGYKAVAMVVVQTSFNIVTLLINYLYCRYRLHIKLIFSRFNRLFFKEVSIYSFWIFLNAIMDRIYWSTGQFVIGMTLGTVAVAVYSVAILLQQLYMAFSVSISGVLLPRITSMVTKGASDREISDMFIRTGRLQYIVMAFILCGFVVFGQAFVDLWSGPGYSAAYMMTLVFFTAILPPLIQNVGISILQARNQMKFRSLLYLGISMVSLLFQIILVKYYGPMGCVWAIAGALVLGQGVIMNIYYQRVQHLDIVKFWIQIGRMSIIPVVVTAAFMMIKDYMIVDGWGALLKWISIFALVYMLLFLTFSTNNYEKGILFSPLRKIADKFRNI
jgi:hypothetical protein